ncbi:hypothetical protein HXX76_005997 [Chlamydomonas incerta]|uniref:Uncharacterized protein n=1 Tax=Chlamydomonas incerta TaxID=51695 RepID=A0A835TEJ3_CHLIN|nr:hypothetical protein HXX76_005997 [Chlamydomonas incerta]|eukprot:KAG2437340.1 hypothetical protein HXX76_005997 [Chlamydomonas incerta]
MVFGGVVGPGAFAPPSSAAAGSGSAPGGPIGNGPASSSLQQQPSDAAGPEPAAAGPPELPRIVTTMANGDAAGSLPNSRNHTPSYAQRSLYVADAQPHSDPNRGGDGTARGAAAGGGMTFDELFEAPPLPHLWVQPGRSPYSTSEVPPQYDSGIYNDLPNSNSILLRATSSGMGAGGGPHRQPPLVAGPGSGLLVIDASAAGGGGGGGGSPSPFSTPTAVVALSASRRALRPASTLGLITTASGQTIKAEAAANAFNAARRPGHSSSTSIGGAAVDAEAHHLQRLRLTSPAPSPRTAATSMGRQAGGNTVEAVRAQQSQMLHRTISSPASRGSLSARATSTGAAFVSGTVPPAYGGPAVGPGSGVLPWAGNSVSGAAADGQQGGSAAGGALSGGPRLSHWLDLHHSGGPGAGGTPSSAPQPYMFGPGAVTAAAAGAAVAAQRQPCPPQHLSQQHAYCTLTQAAHAQQQRQQRQARRMSQPEIVRAFSSVSTSFIAAQPQPPTSEAGGYGEVAPDYGSQGGGIWVRQQIEYDANATYPAHPADVADAFMADCSGGRGSYSQCVDAAAQRRAGSQTAQHASYAWQQQQQQQQQPQGQPQQYQPAPQQYHHHQQPQQYQQQHLSQSRPYQELEDACDASQAAQQGGWANAHGPPPSSTSPSSATETTTTVTGAATQHGGGPATFQMLADSGAGAGGYGYPTSGGVVYAQQQPHSSQPYAHPQPQPHYRGSASWGAVPTPYGAASGASTYTSAGAPGYQFPANEVDDCVAALDVLLEDALEAEGGEPQIDDLLGEVAAEAEAGGSGPCYPQGLYPSAGYAAQGQQAGVVVASAQSRAGAGAGGPEAAGSQQPPAHNLTTASGICVIDFSSAGRPQTAGASTGTGTSSRFSLSRLGSQQHQHTPAAAAAAALMAGSTGPAPPRTASLGSAGVGSGLYPPPPALRTNGSINFVPGPYGGGDTSTGVQSTISGLVAPAGGASSTGMGSLLLPIATDAGAVMGLGAAELAELGFGDDDVNMLG